MDHISAEEILDYLCPGWRQILLINRWMLWPKPAAEPFKNCYDDPTEDDLADYINSAGSTN